MDKSPIIITLQFDQFSFDRLDFERRRYFPADRNFIPAHLTLFHHLPAAKIRDIVDQVGRRCDCEEIFTVSMTGLRFMGGGTAYVAESHHLAKLRSDLAMLWKADLTRQDAQGFRPHVTIQNKVTAEVARSAYHQLAMTFKPFTAQAIGLLLWRYPWEPVATCPFSA